MGEKFHIDERGFALITAEYRTQLTYYAMQFSLERMAAEDLVTDTFLQCWHQRSVFASPVHVRNFLYVTIRNGALNWRAHERIKERYANHVATVHAGELLKSAAEFSHERVEAGLLHQLHTAMQTLPAECKKIFELYLADLSTSEISTMLDLSTATIRSQKRRAIQLIKAWLAENTAILLLFTLIKYFQLIYTFCFPRL